jgi:hypothetical protein
MFRSPWKVAAGLASLAAGTYYFNFFIETVDGSGVYLSATYARADLLVATAVLWLTCFAGTRAAIALLTAEPATRWRSAGLALFAGMMVAVFIRCYLKLAGYGVSDEALSFNWLPMDGHQRWLLATPAVLAALLLLRHSARAAAVLRFLAVCGLVAVVLGAWRLTQTPIGATRQPVPAQPAAAAPAPRRVLWLVLDEFDPQVAFDHAMGVSAHMPRFERLRATSVFMTRAASPAGSTDLSLPAMLLGEPARHMAYAGPGRASLVTLDKRQVPFDTAHSVFGHLPAGPSSGSLLGFYHPYCHALQLGTCVSFGTNMGTQWYDGLANLIPKRFSGLLDPMTRISNQQAKAWPAMVADESRALTVLHLNLPHLPSRFAEQRTGERAANAVQAYAINLRYTDRVVDEILRTLHGAPGSQEQLVIVSSDHWWRVRSQRTPHPALLMIKLRSDDQGMVIDNPVSLHHLAALVVGFLRGELNSHAAIRQWYLNQPYVPTWIPHAD